MNFYANKALCALGCRRLADSDQQHRARRASKLLLCMKLTAFIMLVTCLQTSATGIAQQTITFSGKEVSLENVFAAIKKQTNYKFFFNIESIHHARAVTIDVKNASIEQVLTVALKDQPFTYTIKGRTVFIIQKKEEEKSSSSVSSVQGDPVTVTGRVVDDQGQPLVGANVKIKGTSIGVTTDKDGLFKLTNVEPDATLEISFVGHETQVIPVRGKSFFAVNLAQKLSLLDETVVIAYGTTTKRFNTGNVSSVKASEIEKQPVNNPLLALEGRVPGLFITQTTGVSNGAVNVLVQGQNSIQSGNAPLFVIDGVPYPSDMPSVSIENVIRGGSPLSFINPSDIESVSILKDADATSIYGSRAANGAILITTKKGKAGRTKIDINLQQGWGTVRHKMDMLNTRQYLDMRYEALKNDNINWQSPNVSANDLKVWDTTRYTDWQKTLIGGTANYGNYNVNILGGTSATQYLVGGTYHRETTVFPGDHSDKKGNLHFNLNSASSNQKLRFQLSGSYMYDDNRLPQTDITQKAVLLEPDAPALYNPDGTLNWAPNASGSSTWTNPLASITYNTYQNTTKNLLSRLLISYAILPELELKASAGYTDLNTNTFSQFPWLGSKPEFRTNPNQAAYGNLNMSSWILEPQLTWNKVLDEGKLEALLGTTMQNNTSTSVLVASSGYSSDLLLEDPGSATSTFLTSNYTKYKYNALFGRLNYMLKDRYIVTATSRRDGSSRFGEKNRFHNFWSLAGGWIFSKERFIENTLHFLSFGKLRASYGTTGNDHIPDYAYLSLYYPNSYGLVPYQNTTGLAIVSLSNPYLQWEETKKWQFGADIGIIKDRVLLSVTYARNRSSNQLLGYSLPSITGFTAVNGNFSATVQNTSWEFLLNTKNIQNKTFTWNTSINLTIPKNKLVAFPNLAESGYASTLVIGYPLDVQKLFHFVGVDPTTGLYLVADSHGAPTSTPDFQTDRTGLVSFQPKFYGGMENTLRYKSFELSFLFQFVKRIGGNNKYWNGVRGPGTFIATASNQPTSVLDRWQKPGDTRSIQRYGTRQFFSLAQATDAGGSDAASFIRLKNLSLSWQLPAKWLQKAYLQNCQIFAQGQNLFTITRFDGMDPENQTFNYLPPLRMMTVGIQMGF